MSVAAGDWRTARTAGILLAVVIAATGPAVWPATAHANATPSASDCRAQLPAASQQFFTGCSCSGTTLLIDFQSGSNEARSNDPLCEPAASAPDPSPDSTPTPDQSPTATPTGTSAEGESTYTVTQQTSGSGVDEWLDAVDMDFGPAWITSQTGRFNNRNDADLRRLNQLQVENKQLRQRLDQIRRDLDRLVQDPNDPGPALIESLRESVLNTGFGVDEDSTEADINAAIVAAAGFVGLAQDEGFQSTPYLEKFLELSDVGGRLQLNENQIQALNGQLQERGITPAPFTSFAASGAPDWAVSHGAGDHGSPWRHFSGRVSLNDVRRHMAHRRYLLAQSSDGRPVADRFLIPGPAFDQRFNAWVAGSYTWSEDDRFGAEGDGETGQVTAGVSYAVSETVTVGGQVRYRHMESARNNGTASSDADGFGGSIFAQVLLPFGAIVTPIVAYERTSTDLTQIIGGASLTGDFDTDIWTFGTQAAQRFDVHSDGLGRIIWIEPQASLSYVIADRAAWVRSDGVAVPSDTIETGTLGFGGKIGAEFLAPSEGIVALEPYFGINGVWAFERPADQRVTSGVLVGTPELFAALSAGLNTVFDGGATLSGDVTFSGLGSDIRSWTVGGRLIVPFGG